MQLISGTPRHWECHVDWVASAYPSPKGVAYRAGAVLGPSADLTQDGMGHHAMQTPRAFSKAATSRIAAAVARFANAFRLRIRQIHPPTAGDRDQGMGSHETPPAP